MGGWYLIPDEAMFTPFWSVMAVEKSQNSNAQFSDSAENTACTIETSPATESTWIPTIYTAKQKGKSVLFL